MPWRWFRHVVMRPDVSRYDKLVGGASPLEGESREFDPLSTHERGFWLLEVVIQSAGIPPSHAGGRELESQHAPARNSKGLGLHPRPFSFWLCHGHRLLAEKWPGPPVSTPASSTPSWTARNPWWKTLTLRESPPSVKDARIIP